MRRIMPIGLGLCLVPSLVAGQVATIEVTPSRAFATVGQLVEFKAVAKDARGQVVADAQIVVVAAPFDVAFAEPSGKVRALRQGESQILALVGDKVGTATLTVGPKPPARLTLELASGSIVVGGATVASAAAYSEDEELLRSARIQYSSSDANVATVDATGAILGRAAGVATIVAEAGPAKGSATLHVVANPVARLEISGPATARAGDVVRFAARALDARGGAIAEPPVRWSVSGSGAEVYADGGFVAERPGTYLVSAIAGNVSATSSISVAQRVHARRFERVASHVFRDLSVAEHWAIGSVLYVSTLSDRVYTFDITNPASPVLVDSIQVDAHIINDVSTTADGTIGVITREGASSRRNGIVFLDLTDPLHPKVLSEFTQTVTGGVHSAYVDGRYVYLTDDATGSMRVIDFRDAKNPKQVARWETPGVWRATTAEAAPEGGSGFSVGRMLHDVQVVDGLAYLAYWRDGLVILDVGAGIKGGSPENPQVVSRFSYNVADYYPADRIAGTHTAFRYGKYVFLGDEVFPPMFDLNSRERIETMGIVHVVDVSDLAKPRKVAEYRLQGGAHNLWVDDDVLYIGAYEGGVRALDVSGELRGDLVAQNREIGAIFTGHSGGFRPNLPMAWGAQPHRGFVFATDINSGVWVMRLSPKVGT
jgi:hypothetical protein